VARPAHHAAQVPLAATAHPAAPLGALVGPIAKRCFAATFAAAEIHGRAIRGRVLHGRKLSLRLVRPIAQRLALAPAASTPPVVLSCFNTHRERRIASSNRCWHETLLPRFIGRAASIGRRAHVTPHIRAIASPRAHSPHGPPPNPSLHRICYSGLRPLAQAGELKR
jgi:hypothetical protein